MKTTLAPLIGACVCLWRWDEIVCLKNNTQRKPRKRQTENYNFCYFHFYIWRNIKKIDSTSSSWAKLSWVRFFFFEKKKLSAEPVDWVLNKEKKTLAKPIVFSLRESLKETGINIDYKEKMYSKCFRNMEFVIDFRHFRASTRNSGPAGVCLCTLIKMKTT